MTTSTENIQLVTFRLGADLFAAGVYDVERVLRYQPPTPVPNVPDWIVGVIEYQGRVVPVIDLGKRFELDDRELSGEARILVFNSSGEWIAAIVDAVLEVTSLPQADVSSPPTLFRGLAAQYLKGVVRRGGRLVMYLDVTQLLSTNERLKLEADAAGGEATADA